MRHSTVRRQTDIPYGSRYPAASTLEISLSYDLSIYSGSRMLELAKELHLTTQNTS